MNHALLIPALLELFAKSALILLGAATVATVLPRLSAAQHHVLWLAAFGALLLLPLTKCFAPRWHLPGSPVVPIVTVPTALPQVAVETATVEAMPVPQPQTFHFPDAHHLALTIWLAGAAAILAWRLLGSLRLVGLRRCSVPSDCARLATLARQAEKEMNLRIPCSIRLAEAVRVPCAWGIWRPVVLLPLTAERDWPEARLLAAIRHEFAHVSRRDYLARWVSLVACALYWPNPLVWLAARRLRIAQERACDDLVLTAGTPPDDYAALLVETARAAFGAASALRVAVAMARPSTLEGRVLAIFDETRSRRAAGRLTGLAGALGIGAIIGASALAQIAPEKSAPAAKQNADAKSQIVVRAKFLETPKGAISAGNPEGVGINGVWTRQKAEDFWRGLQTMDGVEILSSPTITVNSGRTGLVQVGRDFDLPSGSTPAKKFVGTGLEVTPTATADAIDVDMKVQHVALKEEATIAAGKPVFDEKKVHFAVTIFDQSTVIVWLGPAQKEGRELYALIEVSKLAPEYLDSPEKQPSAGDAVTITKGAKSIKQDDGLMTKEWKIPLDMPPDKPGTGEPVREFAKDWLISKGVIFEGNAAAIYVPATSRLIVRNTTEQLDLVDQIVSAGTHDQGPAPAKDAPNNGATETTPAPADATAETASRIIIPSIEFREATLQESVAFLQQKGRELSSGEPPVNIVLVVPSGAETPKITLSLKRVPLLEAVRYVAGLTNLAITTRPGAIVIGPHPADTGASGKPLVIDQDTTLTLNKGSHPGVAGESPALTKAKRIIIPKIELREATVAETIDFLRAKAAELDPDKSGVNIILKAPPATDTKLTMSLSEIPLLEALRYTANLAGLELQIEPNAFLFVPLAPEGRRPSAR